MRLIDELHRYADAYQNPKGPSGREIIGTAELLIAAADELERLRPQWIPCSERLPEAEADVEIACVREHYRTGEPIYFTARAFYESGVLTTEDSNFYWEDANTCWEYAEEKDAYVIPEGWWESVYFSDSFKAVDAKVLAWMPLPKPYCEPAQNNECEIEIQQPGRWLETV